VVDQTTSKTNIFIQNFQSIYMNSFSPFNYFKGHLLLDVKLALIVTYFMPS